MPDRVSQNEQSYVRWRTSVGLRRGGVRRWRCDAGSLPCPIRMSGDRAGGGLRQRFGLLSWAIRALRRSSTGAESVSV